MSDSHDAHADAHHAHDFDGEPTDILPDDEPRTPSWVPAVGAAFAVLLAVYLLATRTDEAAEVASATPPRNTATAAAPAATPAPSGAAQAATISPEQIKMIQDRLKAMQNKDASGGAASGSPLAPSPSGKPAAGAATAKPGAKPVAPPKAGAPAPKGK